MTALIPAHLDENGNGTCCRCERKVLIPTKAAVETIVEALGIETTVCCFDCLPSIAGGLHERMLN